MRLPRSFGARLALAVLAGLIVRLLYVALFARKIALFGDAVTYHEWARTIADGTGWVKVPHPELGLFHVTPEPSAEHPPLFSLVLAGFWKLGVHTYTAQKLVVCFIGASTAAFAGLAGREAGGERVGLIAAGLAAFYPFLWVADGSLLAESLYAAFMAAALWLALRFVRTRSLRDGAVLGAVVGLAALSRGEAVLLVPLLLLPLAWKERSLRAAVVMLAGFAIVVAPWTVRNLAKFEQPVLISTNSNSVFAGANCDPVYHGDLIGLWSFSCYGKVKPGDESQEAVEYRKQGIDYARDHAGRMPLIAAIRFARVWDFYRPLQQVQYEFLEGRSRWASRAGLVFYYPTLLLAIAGVVLLRRRRFPVWPFLAFAATVSVVALTVYGITRFRIAAEPALIVLAALSADFALRRRAERRAGQGQEHERDAGHLPVPVEAGVKDVRR
ncbi:MAG TPA: glycosyltransferase family 39 protein [Thermoleophilaceae bacterium]